MKTKTLKITTDNKISVIEVDVNNIKDLQNVIGGGLVEPVDVYKRQAYRMMSGRLETAVLIS